jgi:hypothetical protein
MIKNIIIILCTFLATSTQLKSQSDDFSSLNIPSSKPETINLSDITNDTHHVILSSPADKYPKVIKSTFVDEELILIAYTQNENDVFFKYLNYYTPKGEFMKQTKAYNLLDVDKVRKQIYTLSASNIFHIYSYQGALLDSIVLDVRVDNFKLYNNNLFYATNEMDENNVYQYELHKLILGTNKTKKIHSFTYKGLESGRETFIGSKSNFWINENLYWAHGLGSHVYEINKNDELKQIEVIFAEKRSFMDQVLTGYGIVGHYLYCRYTINIKKRIYLKDLENFNELKISYFNNDDIYNTGKFGFKTNINQKLYFTKKAHEVPEPARTKLNLLAKDILFVYTL